MGQNSEITLLYSVMKNHQYWAIAYWILFGCWVVGAGLFMARYNGGFLTNYLSDLTFPPYFYIHLRGLRTETRDLPNTFFFKQWFGRTPERAAISIFLVGFVTELKTMVWPEGIITGTYDPYDVVAYAVGLVICYAIDKNTHVEG
jgi:hypothetical protein